MDGQDIVEDCADILLEHDLPLIYFVLQTFLFNEGSAFRMTENNF